MHIFCRAYEETSRDHPRAVRDIPWECFRVQCLWPQEDQSQAGASEPFAFYTTTRIASFT